MDAVGDAVVVRVETEELPFRAAPVPGLFVSVVENSLNRCDETIIHAIIEFQIDSPADVRFEV